MSNEMWKRASEQAHVHSPPTRSIQSAHAIYSKKLLRIELEWISDVTNSGSSMYEQVGLHISIGVWRYSIRALQKWLCIKFNGNEMSAVVTTIATAIIHINFGKKFEHLRATQKKTGTSEAVREVKRKIGKWCVPCERMENNFTKKRRYIIINSAQCALSVCGIIQFLCAD